MSVVEIQLLIFSYVHVQDCLTQNLRSIFKIELYFISSSSHIKSNFGISDWNYRGLLGCCVST
jgi:hypothetical protein